MLSYRKARLPRGYRAGRSKPHAPCRAEERAGFKVLIEEFLGP